MSPEAQSPAFPSSFLDGLQARGWPIVIKVPSPFTIKFFSFCKVYKRVNPTYGKRLSLDMCDSEKVIMVREDEIQSLPDYIEEQFAQGKIKDDDRYLVELSYTVPGSVIVTKDNPLVASLRPFLEERVALLAPFCASIGLHLP